VKHLNFGGHQHISRTAEATVVKFGTQVGYVKSQHMDDKSPLKEAWSGRGQGDVTYFKFCGPNNVSAMAEARVVNFY